MVPRSPTPHGENNHSMAPKRKIASDNAVPKSSKKGRRHDSFESQDIWKNLDKIRTENSKASNIIPNSHVFVPLYGEYDDHELCIGALHEFVDPSKLQLVKHPVIPCYVCLKNFSLLDCCLVISILFAHKNRKWIIGNKSQELFTIPGALNIAGCFQLPSNYTGYNEVRNVRESQFQNYYNFKEYYVCAKSLSQFMQTLVDFFHGIKFGKPTRDISIYYSKALNRTYQSVDFGLKELSFLREGLYNPTHLTNINLPSIEKSKNNLQIYAQELIRYNCSKELSLSSVSRDKSPAATRQGIPSRSNTSNTTRPHFMTQDQIKQHCIATIKASQLMVKTKSQYQIMKTYVKCPRQGYIDRVYQNLNDLRAQTNCNIVVLNLNNLHESRPWFDSLDVSKFTTHIQQPHPSTVRVVSIGGVGERIQKALQLVYNILLE